MTTKQLLLTLGALPALAILACVQAEAPADSSSAAHEWPTEDWPHHGGDLGAAQYSALFQIDAANVETLRVAWRWETPDWGLLETLKLRRAPRFEAIPIVADGVLFTSTSFGGAAALDAENGMTRWTYDPESWRAGEPTNLGFVHRGLALWREGDDQRLLLATTDAWLIALDARTGQPDPAFGVAGRVDLIDGIPNARRPETGAGPGNFTVSSAPVVCRDTAIVGSSIADRPNRMTMPRGDVRGYDVRSGALLWTFHTIPQDGEPGNETWQEDSWRYSGNTNVWTPMSADQDLGLAYLPLSTPTNDYYGGHRLGHNLYAESLVAVDCRSGERAWHFQAVHHGLWDYDFPAAATLVDLERDGATVQAVAQVSKQGFTYVFDRRTGEPLWPIEERAVPQSDVPGEVTSPTQPHPSKPPPFEMQGAAEENLIDWTPELRAEALEIFRRYRSGPLFSPPSVQGSFQIPGSAGGANWGGAAFDPESGLLFVPSITVPTLVRSFEADPNRSDFRYLGERIFSFTVGFGSGEAQGLTGPRGLPLFKPPYSRVTALDLHTGTLAWQVPTGDGPRQQVAAILGRDPGPLGSASRGHVLATKTLLFVTFAAPDETPALLVLDKQTGATVTSIALPAAPSSTPVTFLDGSGRQLVVVAIAGSPPSLLALALPD